MDSVETGLMCFMYIGRSYETHLFFIALYVFIRNVQKIMTSRLFSFVDCFHKSDMKQSIIKCHLKRSNFHRNNTCHTV